MNRRTALRTLAGAASLAPLAMLANESTAPSSAKNQEAVGPVAQPRLPRVRVHPDGHLLQLEDGRPFFWLGDTAWELIHRATRDEVAIIWRRVGARVSPSSRPSSWRSSTV
jgi:hypothetical protein